MNRSFPKPLKRRPETYKRKYPRAQAPTVTVAGTTFSIVETAKRISAADGREYDGQIDLRHNILWTSPMDSQERRAGMVAKLVADAATLRVEINRPRFSTCGIRQPVFIAGANYDIADSAELPGDYLVDHFFHIIWISSNLSAKHRIIAIANAVAMAAENRLEQWSARAEWLERNATIAA